MQVTQAQWYIVTGPNAHAGPYSAQQLAQCYNKSGQELPEGMHPVMDQTYVYTADAFAPSASMAPTKMTQWEALENIQALHQYVQEQSAQYNVKGTQPLKVNESLKSGQWTSVSPSMGVELMNEQVAQRMDPEKKPLRGKLGTFRERLIQSRAPQSSGAGPSVSNTRGR